MRRATVHAQTAPVTTAPPARGDRPSCRSGFRSGKRIVVTGSRIARPDYEAPNPIVSFGSVDLQRSGNTNVTTFLQRVLP